MDRTVIDDRCQATPEVAVSRRVATVLSAGARAYRALMDADEVGTVQTITGHRAAMRDAVWRFNGRVVDTPGDNLLAEFASTVDAVACAVDIQRVLADRNAWLPDARRLDFQIGVEVGEIIVDDARIYGETVAAARHVEALAEAGGVCVSSDVYEHVGNALPLMWQSLGEHSGANTRPPVRVLRALLDTSRPPRGRSAARGLTDRPSIAVLPFREVGAGEDRRYFGEGLVEDIVGALASLADLFVVARTSAARVRETSDITSVGRELGVRYVLTGRVRRFGARLRIAAELADVDTRAVVWTDTVDGQADRLFDVQDRLARRTVTTLAPHVHEAQIRRALRKRPQNLDAYDCTLRGLDLLYRGERSDFDRARDMFGQAIARDRTYAAPYALAATWHSIRLGHSWSANPAADYDMITALSVAALERDPLEARALALCGHARALRFRDYEGAITLFDRATAASPNSPTAWVRSSPTYCYLGRAAEAKRRALLALRLSPLDPQVFYTYAALAFASYTAGDFEEAASWAARSRAENPVFATNLRLLAASLAAAGRRDEAAEVAAALMKVEPTFRVEPFCASHPFKDAYLRNALGTHLKAAGLA